MLLWKFTTVLGMKYIMHLGSYLIIQKPFTLQVVNHIVLEPLLNVGKVTPDVFTNNTELIITQVLSQTFFCGTVQTKLKAANTQKAISPPAVSANLHIKKNKKNSTDRCVKTTKTKRGKTKKNSLKSEKKRAQQKKEKKKQDKDGDLKNRQWMSVRGMKPHTRHV